MKTSPLLFDGFELLTFRFAWTMPDLPHEYTIRRPEDPAANAAYDTLFARIMAEGVREFAPARPGKRRYKNRYWYPGDGYKYWAMTTKREQSLGINRTRVDYYDADNSPVPEIVALAQRAATAMARMPAAERRQVTLSQAIGWVPHRPTS